jgi:hypothetical protein
MLDRYGTPRAFRQALEARLMAQSKTTGVDLGRLRRSDPVTRNCRFILMTHSDNFDTRGDPWGGYEARLQM